jgi:hypothetical protein
LDGVSGMKGLEEGLYQPPVRLRPGRGQSWISLDREAAGRVA